MPFARLFGKSPPRLSFSPDIPENERPKLLAELQACAHRRGGTLNNARRAQALADLFLSLSPAGQQVFADTLNGLNETAHRSTGDRYAEIEEAELFGRSESKLAVLDMFETPRRRVLRHMCGAENGNALLEEIRQFSAPDLQREVDRILEDLS